MAKQPGPKPKPIECYYNINNITGCWDWIGGIAPGGRPIVAVKRKAHQANRYIFHQKYGSNFPPHILDPLCKNKYCVNPDHMKPRYSKKHQNLIDSIQMINTCEGGFIALYIT